MYTLNINPENGDIFNIYLLRPGTSEGFSEDGSYYIKIIDGDIGDPETFLSTYYLSEDYSEFLSRPARPADYHYATWNRQTVQWETTLDKLLTGIRQIRNELLLASDWTQLPDAYLTTVKKAEWATYRRDLRNITESIKSSPTNYLNFTDVVTWPTPPE